MGLQVGHTQITFRFVASDQVCAAKWVHVEEIYTAVECF